MAYIFPVDPYDGQLYPVPASPGSLQYQWSAASQVWLIFSPLGVQSVTGVLPITVSNGTDNAVVRILPATINNPGSMSAEDKFKLDSIPPDAGSGTVTSITAGEGLTGGTITDSGTISLSPATTSSLGGVKIGDNIQVFPDGTIGIPTASFGVTSLNIGPGLVGNPAPITGTGTISSAIATRSTIGAVRVGNGLNIALDGTISLGGSLGNVSVLAWGTVGVSGGTTFTLLEGYNISSIEWNPSDQPRARVYFQTTLANNLYGVMLSARVSSFGAGASKYQNNVLMNFSFKSISYTDILCVGFKTLDNTTGSMTTVWNDWADVVEFDIVIIDTAVYS